MPCGDVMRSVPSRSKVYVEPASTPVPAPARQGVPTNAGVVSAVAGGDVVAGAGTTVALAGGACTGVAGVDDGVVAAEVDVVSPGAGAFALHAARSATMPQGRRAWRMRCPVRSVASTLARASQRDVYGVVASGLDKYASASNDLMKSSAISRDMASSPRVSLARSRVKASLFLYASNRASR